MVGEIRLMVDYVEFINYEILLIYCIIVVCCDVWFWVRVKIFMNEVDGEFSLVVFCFIVEGNVVMLSEDGKWCI